jgi:hypothetical protein
MAFPTDIRIAQLTKSLITPTQILKSISGQEERSQIAASYYQLETTFNNLTSAERKKLLAFIASVGVALDSFEIVLPDTISDTETSFSGTITINDEVGTVANSVDVTANTTNATVLQAGDYFKFPNHSKVYMVTQDVDVDGSGVGTLNYFPYTRTTVSNGSSLTFNDVPMTVRLANPNVVSNIQVNEFSTFTILLNEVI